MAENNHKFLLWNHVPSKQNLHNNVPYKIRYAHITIKNKMREREEFRTQKSDWGQAECLL